MPSIKLYPGDNRETLRTLIEQGVKVHSVCTDPPYVMDSVIKRFGKEGSAKALPGRDGAFNRSSEKFIGKTWDASEIAFDPSFWQLIRQILLPGGFVFSAAGPRTVDRQMTAMREAGFVIYPLHAWGFKTGLPKGHPSPRGKGFVFGAGGPKVDFEPLILAMNPIDTKTFKANIEKHGVGDLNIDACKSDSGKYPSTIVFYPKADADDRAGGKHPTVKPIALMQYLIRHVTPPGGIVLDPFAGSGTTGEAAAREGFDCLLMEAESEYVDFLDERFSNREDLVYTNEDSDDDIRLDLDDDIVVIDSDDDGDIVFDIEIDLGDSADLDGLILADDDLDLSEIVDAELEPEEDIISLEDV